MNFECIQFDINYMMRRCSLSENFHGVLRRCLTLSDAVFSQARCIAGQQGDVESSRWLVGTLSVRDANEVGV